MADKSKQRKYLNRNAFPGLGLPHVHPQWISDQNLQIFRYEG